MTRTASQSADLKKYVEEVTKCPICCEDIHKPRILPCLHSYCLECIRAHCKDKNPGDHVECPVCRNEYVIPVDGIDQLPHNFFLDGLVEAKKISYGISNIPDKCGACSDDVSSAEAKEATKFCAYCQQKLCDQCSKPHSKIPDGLHKIVQYGAEEIVKAIKLQSSWCKKHKGNKLELYCLECEENLCLVCKNSQHDGHYCKAIVDVYKKCVQEMQNDSVYVNEQAQQLLNQMEVLVKKQKEYDGSVGNTEQEIHKTGQDIKLFADNTVAQITDALAADAERTNKSIESVKNQIEFLLIARRSYLTYSEELLKSGNQCDVTDAYKGLRARVIELQAENEKMTVADDYKVPSTTVTSYDVYNKVYEFVRDRSAAHERWKEEKKETQTDAIAVVSEAFGIKLAPVLEENGELKAKLAKSDPENKPIAVIRADLETKLGAASGENDELKKMSPKSDEKIKQLADVKETDTKRKQLPGSMTQTPRDSVTRKVKMAVGVLDDLVQQIALFLQRYPLARISVCLYAVVFHLFLILALLTHQPDTDKLLKEINDQQTSVSKLNQQLSTKQTFIEKVEKELEENQSLVSKLNQQIASYQSDIQKLKREVADKQCENSTCCSNRLTSVLSDKFVSQSDDIDPCSSWPCSNNGTCRSSGATFTCDCTALFTDSRCTTMRAQCLIDIWVSYNKEPPSNAIREDINRGFGGKFVWLVPIWSYTRRQVVTDIDIRIGSEIASLSDLAKGAGGAFRYLRLSRSDATSTCITSVGISRTRVGGAYRGDWPHCTRDINDDRGGDYLYLCWRFA